MQPKLLPKLFPLLFIALIASTSSHSQYADLGSGGLKNQIWWIDWDGFSMANGSTRNFTTTNGLNVTVTFSNISGPLLRPSIMNTWPGAVLHLLYNFSNPNIKPALYHSREEINTTSFTMTVIATRNGTAVPIQFIAADAEASTPAEVTTLTTNGSNWNSIDFFRNSMQNTNPISGCNTNTISINDTYGSAPTRGQNPVVSTRSPTNGALVIDVSMNHNGVLGLMGLAFGVLETVDRGDLPASFGYAQHQISYTYNNSCNYLPPYPNAVQSNNLKLGNLPGDADGIQSMDDNLQGPDEDAISNFPIYTGNGIYSLTIPVTNATGTNAHLSAWFDSNGNGIFEASELQTQIIPNNATTATISWNGLPTSFSYTANYGFRFRLSTNSAGIQEPSGYVNDGEVEDYFVKVPQITQVSFQATDTVCVNSPVTVTNTSIGASSYYWNFCTANVNTAPVGTNLGNIGNQFNSPVYIDYVFEAGNYYGFLTNNWPGNLLRLDFGNSLMNTPAITDLGTVGGVVPANTEGIQIIKNEGKWYLIIVGGDPVGGNQSRIVKIELGVNINNNSPTGTNWGNIGNLAYPHDLYVFDDDGHWYGVTVNTSNNTITRFDFSTSFSNTPTGVNLGNIGGLHAPTGVHAFKDNGNWIAFITNANGNSLTRLDFGNSLLNVPIGVNLGNVDGKLNTPWDIYVMKYCGENLAFVVNAQSNDLVKLDFGSDLTSVPSASSYGNMGNLNFPHCLSKVFRVGADLHTLIPNAGNNTLSRLTFSGCTNTNIPNSILQNPPAITYNRPGVYNINLTVDDGLATQSSFCKTVVVVDNLHTPLQSKTICTGDSIQLTSSNPTGNQWNTGSTSNSIYVKTPGIYWVQSTNGSCTNVDSFVVTGKPVPDVDLGKDTAICHLDSLLLNAANAGASYTWQDGQTAQEFMVSAPGLYHVIVNKEGCIGRDSIEIAILPQPTLSISSDTSICKSDSITLSSSSSAILNSWYPYHGLSSINELVIKASPDTTTTYYLTITDNNNCTARDSVTVKVVNRPQIELGQDTAVCSSDSLMLNAGNNGSEFTWQDGQNTQTIIVKNAGLYLVTVNNDGCIAQDSIIVTSLPSPQVIISADTTICRTGTAILTGAGGTRYSWATTTGIVDSSSTLTISPDTTTSFFLTVTGSNGCTTRDSVTVTVVPRPDFTVKASKPVACLGDSILLTAAGGNNYSWSPSSSLSHPNGQMTLAYPSASTSYKVVIENSACRMTDSVFIYLPVADKPQVSITKSNDINCFQGTASLTAGGGARYVWMPSAGLSDSTIQNPIVSISKTATYFVSITTVDGCELMDSITVNVAKGDDGTGFPVPSAFTPNNDGKNDCFSVQHWGEVKDFSLYLFNRWGELIFQADQPTKCWNGIYKGVTQPTGVYVYLIRAKTLCGDIFRKGTVTLIR